MMLLIRCSVVRQGSLNRALVLVRPQKLCRVVVLEMKSILRWTLWDLRQVKV